MGLSVEMAKMTDDELAVAEQAAWKEHQKAQNRWLALKVEGDLRKLEKSEGELAKPLPF